jgi:hypothetical protein
VEFVNFCYVKFYIQLSHFVTRGYKQIEVSLYICVEYVAARSEA